MVAFIPEGLPVCIAISLALVAKNLKQNKILAKSLMTVEALGAVDITCSDKTGTLTMNKMSVVSVYTFDAPVFEPHQATSLVNEGIVSENVMDRLAMVAKVLNCTMSSPASVHE